jgi:cell division protein FtsQ
MGLFRRKRRTVAKNRGSGKGSGRSSSLPPNRRRKRPAAKGDGKRSSGPKKDRRRLKRIVLGAVKLFVAGVLTGLAVWGGVQGYRHATTSDYFAVDDIRVDGNKQLSRTEVLAAGRIEAGMNIFSVDVDEVAARLLTHPWIADAGAARRLPRSLSIEVVERKVEAMVLFDVPYLVDDSGEVFKRWVTGDPLPRPIVTGFTREEYAVDEEIVRGGIRDAIALARRYRAAGIERRAPLHEIHHEVDGSFSLSIGKDPFYVKFGKGPYRRKLRRLGALLTQIERDGQSPAIVFFDNEVRPDRVTVKVKPRDEQSAPEIVDLTTRAETKKPPKI